MVTFTCASWPKPLLGTNSSVSVPAPCHVPATAGLMLGIGEPGATACENWILIEVSPLTPVALLAGVSDTSVSGPAGVLGVGLELGRRGRGRATAGAARRLGGRVSEGDPDASDQEQDDHGANSRDPPAQMRQ